MEPEVWKEIEFGNGNYSISSLGRVRNNLSGNIISFQIQNSGYKIVHLYESGNRKAMTIHRQVAIAFVKKVPGKNKVDHIDGNKLNNYYLNLRWADDFDNMQYASANGLLDNAAKKASVRMKEIGSKHGFDNSQKFLRTAKPIDLVVDGQILKFRSVRQASLYLKIDHKTLSGRIKRGVYQ